jgi:hypothetical protein
MAAAGGFFVCAREACQGQWKDGDIGGGIGGGPANDGGKAHELVSALIEGWRWVGEKTSKLR